MGSFSDRPYALLKELYDIFPEEQILAAPVDRVGFASDASFYRLIPSVVVQPGTDTEIQDIFRLARQMNTPVVFRAAGTSLSGQSITDGILVDIGRYWRKHAIREQGKFIRLQPGVIGEHANRYLQPFQRRLGPDPASMSACMIGGILANNASGMRCGVHRNAYHTLEDIRFILPNGHLYDSGDSHARKQFASRETDLMGAIRNLKKQIISSKRLSAILQEKYQRKNTTGYGLNAFIDYEDPFDIFCHLLIGSEGTLAFISEATLRTLPDPPYKATGLVITPSLEATVSLVEPLKELRPEAVELMDRASLASVEYQAGVPDEVKSVGNEAAALLVEFQSDSAAALDESVRDAEKILNEADPEYFSGFSGEADFQTRLWSVRKGLYPSVGAVRDTGTSVIIEDIAFPLQDLGPATRQVRELLDQHGYEQGIIFGHARDGNLHFVITQKFDAQGSRQYRALIEDIVSLVVEKYNGSLKGEHGTGRNMAPFVETEWGEELYAIMGKLKRAVDPENILNPGVILNPDPEAHLKDIKHLPSVDTVVDNCVECGFCEPVCPSRDVTTTPRRRIVIWREIARLEEGDAVDQMMANELKRAYQYEAIETCAADGMCSTACPVDIDTGTMMKYLRSTGATENECAVAEWCANHFALVTHGLRFLLTLAEQARNAVGTDIWNRWIARIRKVTGGFTPGWNDYMPGGSVSGIPETGGKATGADVVYFPSCLSRTMGKIPGEVHSLSTSEAICEVLDRAGLTYWFPVNLHKLCCGTPWSSKGFPDTFRKMAERMTRALWISSDRGRIPVVTDTSPCSYTMLHYDEILTGEPLRRWQALQLYDIVEYLHDTILPRLTLRQMPGTVVCHPTCSTVKMEQTAVLLGIAQQCSEEAVIPQSHGCCGFAGDRGLFFPELTESATRTQAAEIGNLRGNIKGYYSTSRTCEVGLSSATDRSYSSIVHLVERVSRSV